jgi:arginase family enzyme
VVEVLPDHDHAAITATLAAAVAFEILSLVACNVAVSSGGQP